MHTRRYEHTHLSATSTSNSNANRRVDASRFLFMATCSSIAAAISFNCGLKKRGFKLCACLCMGACLGDVCASV